MRQAGFVLVGGRSSRMGRDKALLPYAGTTLAGHLAGVMKDAVGSVSLIGDPLRYGHLGFPVYPDRFPGAGPAGGIATALAAGLAEWNAVVACDMPDVSPEWLRTLLEIACKSTQKCVLSTQQDGAWEPLCGVYHASCLPVLEDAIRANRLKMKDLARELDALPISSPPGLFRNVNTPADWTSPWPT